MNEPAPDTDEVAVATAAGPAVPAELQATFAIERLLDDPIPADWSDPTAIERRRDRLAAASVAAAEHMVELLVQLPQERRRTDAAGRGVAQLVIRALHRLRRELLDSADYSRSAAPWSVNVRPLFYRLLVWL
jgi:hypothetical protein